MNTNPRWTRGYSLPSILVACCVCIASFVAGVVYIAPTTNATSLLRQFAFGDQSVGMRLAFAVGSLLAIICATAFRRKWHCWAAAFVGLIPGLIVACGVTQQPAVWFAIAAAGGSIGGIFAASPPALRVVTCLAAFAGIVAGPHLWNLRSPSRTEVVYHGSYQPDSGVLMNGSRYTDYLPGSAVDGLAVGAIVVALFALLVAVTLQRRSLTASLPSPNARITLAALLLPAALALSTWAFSGADISLWGATLASDYVVIIAMAISALMAPSRSGLAWLAGASGIISYQYFSDGSGDWSASIAFVAAVILAASLAMLNNYRLSHNSIAAPLAFGVLAVFVVTSYFITETAESSINSIAVLVVVVVIAFFIAASGGGSQTSSLAALSATMTVGATSLFATGHASSSKDADFGWTTYSPYTPLTDSLDSSAVHHGSTTIYTLIALALCLACAVVITRRRSEPQTLPESFR